MSTPNLKRNKKPWPTKKAMEQVYEMNLWGTNNTKFYSGEGSHNPTIVKPYLSAVRSFLTSFKNPLSVCDLGCGDFNIGKELVEFTKNYIAVDIVEDLIEENKVIFKKSNLEFQQLDIAADDLPKTDCVIIRQVLQHLSNIEVQHIVKKLYNYRYIILTEHLPSGNFTPNKDIISGQGIRLKKQSGINLLVVPFNFKVKYVKELVAIDLKNNLGVIVTNLYEV
ncbi:class I SAM-dependent methyltransferase [Lutibacter sp. Hel_I_33_5]|uniref:class I SAM-dependent methyltransferase n=1 Tax=Lutibacter sp. Hel_I_33_5 TaxID=1566289 RepID=UPI00351AF39D